jgi:hypothetical protein
MDTFPLVLTLAAVLAVGLALGAVIGVLWARSRPADDTAIAALQQRVADHAVVQDGLERLQDQLSDLAHDRTAWQAQLHQQVADVRRSTDVLRHETHTLATALRKPQVRGQWGELHLRRTVELAGLVDHCDFAEQTRLDDGRLRPDLVVTLAGGRTIAVDAKAPLAAFLDLTGADDPGEHERALARLGEHVRKHVADLGSRRYWEALAGTPEFVVLFLPGEAILQAALQAVPDLVEQAAARNVVLATPSTLIALLRTVGARGAAARAGAARAAGLDGRTPRQGGPLPQRQRRRLQPGGGVARGTRAGVRTPVRRSGGHQRPAGGPSPGRDRAPLGRRPRAGRPGRRPRSHGRPHARGPARPASRHGTARGAPRTGRLRSVLGWDS